MEDIKITQVLLAATIVGLTEIIKRTGKVPENWLPVVSLLLGPPIFLLGAFATIPPGEPVQINWAREILFGLAVGAGATGLFVLAKQPGRAAREEKKVV